MNIEKVIDHTILQPTAQLGEFTQGIRDCIKYKFPVICVSSFHVPLVSSLIHSYIHTDMNMEIKTASTIGFPNGNSNIESKIEEMKQAFNDGATEFDFVCNLSAVKSGDWQRIRREFESLRQAIPFNTIFQPILKVILEVGSLTDDEIKKASELAINSRIDFLKTSTGFLNKLPIEKTAKYVKMLKDFSKGSDIKIKASGGIKTLQDLELVLQAGADRVGTSNGVKIMEELIKV